VAFRINGTEWISFSLCILSFHPKLSSCQPSDPNLQATLWPQQSAGIDQGDGLSRDGLKGKVSDHLDQDGLELHDGKDATDALARSMEEGGESMDIVGPSTAVAPSFGAE